LVYGWQQASPWHLGGPIRTASYLGIMFAHHQPYAGFGEVRLERATEVVQKYGNQ